jgi:hypothetical protein
MPPVFSKPVPSMHPLFDGNRGIYNLTFRKYLLATLTRLEREIALGSAQAPVNEVDLIYGPIQGPANNAAKQQLVRDRLAYTAQFKKDQNEFDKAQSDGINKILSSCSTQIFNDYLVSCPIGNLREMWKTLDSAFYTPDSDKVLQQHDFDQAQTYIDTARCTGKFRTYMNQLWQAYKATNLTFNAEGSAIVNADGSLDSSSDHAVRALNQIASRRTMPSMVTLSSLFVRTTTQFSPLMLTTHTS